MFLEYLFVRAKKEERCCILKEKIRDSIVCLLLVLPFFLNDFLFIRYSGDFFKILAVDLGTRVFVLIVCLLFCFLKGYAAEDWNLLRLPRKTFWWGTLFLLCFGILVVDFLGGEIQDFFSELTFFWYPIPPTFLFKILNLSIGLGLVAISEELVFRGFLISCLKKYSLGTFGVTFISSILFGAIHWSNGVHIIFVAFIWGIASSFFATKYRSIYPAMISHYFINFIIYSSSYFWN